MPLTLELVKLLWESVLVKKSSIISIISNNEDLLDLLEEAFLLQGKFSLSIFNSDMFLEFISKTDIFDAIIIS